MPFYGRRQRSYRRYSRRSNRNPVWRGYRSQADTDLALLSFIAMQKAKALQQKELPAPTALELPVNWFNIPKQLFASSIRPSMFSYNSDLNKRIEQYYGQPPIAVEPLVSPGGMNVDNVSGQTRREFASDMEEKYAEENAHKMSRID